MTTDATTGTIESAVRSFRRGEVSSVELTRAALGRADDHDATFGVFLTRMPNVALAAAERADAERAQGVDRGPLHGIPVGIKDIIATRDAPTTAQSLVPFDVGADDAPVVARLRDAGAVIVGKTTTMEFANGLPDPDSPFPLPRNPWRPTHWAGGSSSGNGSGLITGMFLGAVGTDTGGSIRAPASYCGTTGLKPTFGRVPKSGCVPNGFTIDHVGPMARSAWDCAAMLGAMAGAHPSDPTAASVPVPDYVGSLDRPPRRFRVAIEREHHIDAANVDPEVRVAYDEMLSVLRGAGAEIVVITLPEWPALKAAFSLTSMVEKYAIHRDLLPAHWDRYGRNTRFSSGQGALVSAGDYVKAQRVRRRGVRAMFAALEPFDALVVPTTACPAPPLDGLAFESLIAGAPTFTAVWNLLGFPALALPVGFSRAGLPLSAQVVGKPFDEVTVLQLAHRYQQVTDWHLAVPST
jgi:aspartyl-tRNA(Asn)/glutamyl-tRNA(Gln) amidotransferase subunit A